MWFRRKPSKRRRSVAAPSALATHYEAPASALQRVRLLMDLHQIGIRIIRLGKVLLRSHGHCPTVPLGSRLSDRIKQPMAVDNKNAS